MKKNLLLLVAAALWMNACKPVSPVTYAPPKNSDYIFSGSLVSLRGSTLPTVVGEDAGSIVKVHDVIYSAGYFDPQKGKEITVILSDELKKKARSAEGGEKTVQTYYARTWLFGSSLAVIANDVVPGDGTQQMKEGITNYAAQKLSDTLRQRVKTAELVVQGKIDAIRDTPASKRDSEHDPIWKMGTLRVTSVLKGSKSVTTIDIVFAGSDDVQWRLAPKFEEGQEGIFLLRREDKNANAPEGFVITHPLDFQPIVRKKEISRMIN